MADYGWGKARSVEEWLFADGAQFNFFQAVKLLELLHPDATPVGEGSEPDNEPVRFTSTVNFQFPASAIMQIENGASNGTEDADHPPTMEVNFLGLAGAHGPLPHPITEDIFDRLRSRDPGGRDFLDLFNHRLVSLLHRGRKIHRVGFTPDEPGNDPVAHHLFALLGLGTRGLRHRMAVPDRSLLPYTGLLNQQPRSAIGLQLLLSDYFQVPVRIEQFQGRWHPLSEDAVTRIGLSGQNQYLGQWAVLGRRVWDQQQGFTIHMGPMGFEAFVDLLPTGSAFASLCQLTRFYVGEVLAFDVELILEGDEVPEMRLRDAGRLAALEKAVAEGAEVSAGVLDRVSGPSLGWTSWLGRRGETEEDLQVRLRETDLG